MHGETLKLISVTDFFFRLFFSCYIRMCIVPDP